MADVAFPADLAPLFRPKGSVAVDGISLTVAGLATTQFDVMIIPFTGSTRTCPRCGPGDRVNLECDMIGKYVARMRRWPRLELRTLIDGR